MSLKLKLILLALLPLMLVSMTIGWISIHQMSQLGKLEIDTFETSLMETREQALHDYLDLALNSIQHLTERNDIPKVQAQQAVKQVLEDLTYGKDGYFFVYDQYGTNLVHPIQPELVGKNLYDLQDEKGNYLIRSLLDAALDGGGFHRYLWQKPSTGDTVTKLSYARWIPEWHWMIGTGLYIDDIEQQLNHIQKTIDNNIKTTFMTVCALLLVTVLVILCTALAINLHEHRLADDNLKTLAHKTVMFQENEKKHLARELHDGVNQTLVSSKCHFELLEKQLPQLRENSAFTYGLSTLINTITDLRQISHSLRPSTLDDIGLNAALQGLLESFSHHSSATVHYTLPHEAIALNSDISTTLYRVAQESLANIQKHASAHHVELVIEILGQNLQLIIRDDGVGFHLQQALSNDGIGLKNMRERIEFIGGQFEIVTEPGYGTEISVVITYPNIEEI
ncbi:cache domain-containing protein [Thaumasiovibrio sp. DFM-14]|uniref:cache domain-containing protein n=1 Tax=Thaumasiovibrio sp. DFM-14 TaxID=3384792 RepID=UPI0039A0D622